MSRPGQLRLAILPTLFVKFQKMKDNSHTWEQAVQWLREQPDQQKLARDCYYDDPLLQTVQRFADGEEWQAVRSLIPLPHGEVLDVGAGRGISSYAFAVSGWQVTALEPNPSSLVGTGAIREIIRLTDLPIRVVEEPGESLHFPDGSFDLVYGRQILHHMPDLKQFCAEAFRVLKPGGWFLATREHVISRQEDLPVFLANHPLHKLYGGENAHLLAEYLQAITKSGLRIKRILGPLDSAINYFPMSEAEWRISCAKPLERRLGKQISHFLLQPRTIHGRWILRQLARRQSRLSKTPGRLYSFVAQKPG
jgi:ubiquinone/menaquinone biosynthesis C-methylase UbiE